MVAIAWGTLHMYILVFKPAMDNWIQLGCYSSVLGPFLERYIAAFGLPANAALARRTLLLLEMPATLTLVNRLARNRTSLGAVSWDNSNTKKLKD